MGHPVPWGHKYGDLVLQVAGSANNPALWKGYCYETPTASVEEEVSGGQSQNWFVEPYDDDDDDDSN
jgi:hypothetical protein